MKDPNSQNSTKPTTSKVKKPLGRRLGESARSLRDTVNEPRQIPKKAQNVFRRWARKVWEVRGGGLYAAGYALTFIILETRTIFGEIAESKSVGDFVTSQLGEFIFRFFGESIANFVKALMWPIYVIRIDPMWGGIALAAGFILFDRVLKKPVAEWLARDD